MADLLGIGLSALLAQQRALATTSNNVANASTPGYSRQRTELSERPTEQLGPYFAGTGVTSGLNRRITDGCGKRAVAPDVVTESERFGSSSGRGNARSGPNLREFDHPSGDSHDHRRRSRSHPDLQRVR